MQFCYICNVGALSSYGDRSRTHLALAQVIKRSDLARRAYVGFYRERAQRGDYVILDNGAYEGDQLTTSGLLAAIEEFQPSAIVLPDYPGDFDKTESRSVDFLCALKRHCGVGFTDSIPIHTIKVLHAADGNLEAFVNSWKTARYYGVDRIGLSRLTGRYGVPVTSLPVEQEDVRPGFVRYLSQLGLYDSKDPERQKIHAFGMCSGSLKELKALADLGVTSCDSSAPIWRGMWGYRLEDTCWVDEPFNPLLRVSVPTSSYQFIEYNIQQVEEAIRGKAD